jgi:hypothetical protein
MGDGSIIIVANGSLRIILRTIIIIGEDNCHDGRVDDRFAVA